MLKCARSVGSGIALVALWGWCGGAGADVIRLSSGERLTVEIIEQTADTIRFVHPVLGEITVSTEQATIVPEEQIEAEQEKAKAKAAEPPEPVLPAPAPTGETPPPKEWKYKIVGAAAGATGNTENANGNIIFTATRENDQLRTIFDASYFFGSSNGDRSENRLSTGLRNDWLNPGSKWFYFADARYDYDEFQSWDSRLSGHVGLGYRLIEPPKWLINLRGGIGALKEFGSSNDDVRPEALLGIEGKWTITDQQSFTFDSTIFPSLEDTEEFRWVNNAGWSVLLDQKNRLSLTAGLGHEYQSEVDPGREKNDLRVFAGLQFDF